MWNIIKYDKRRSKFNFGIYLNKKQIKKEIIFDSSCKYELPNNDWLDINKLFGIGYFIKHSKDSARFGWRYNPNENLIDIFAYCYVNKDRIKKYITIYNIDISHFNPFKVRGESVSLFARKKYPTSNYLIKGSNINSTELKKRLYSENILEPKCSMCGQDEYWNGKRMSLILDHIDGDHTNNILENLRIVCSNCNATLDTHCGKNKIKDRTYINRFVIEKKEKLTYQQKLLNKGINLEILKNEVWLTPTIQLCKKYNLSDRGLGKICEKNNIPKPPRGYWMKKNSNMG